MNDLGGGRAITPSPATHKPHALRAFRSIPTAHRLAEATALLPMVNNPALVVFSEQAIALASSI